MFVGWAVVSGVVVVLAALSSVLVEGPATRMLGMFERDGSRREYYPHLVAPRADTLNATRPVPVT